MTNRTRPTADTTPYLNRLKDWDHDDLQAIAEYVISLEDHPGWQALTRLVDEVHADAWSNVIGGHGGARGRVLEQAEYARLHGFLAGLNEFQAAQKAFRVADERRREANARAARS